MLLLRVVTLRTHRFNYTVLDCSLTTSSASALILAIILHPGFNRDCHAHLVIRLTHLIMDSPTSSLILLMLGLLWHVLVYWLHHDGLLHLLLWLHNHHWLVILIVSSCQISKLCKLKTPWELTYLLGRTAADIHLSIVFVVCSCFAISRPLKLSN